MTNWPAVISALRESGMSYQQMKAATGAKSASTFREIEERRTKEPRYALGAKLLDLHKRRVKRAA